MHPLKIAYALGSLNELSNGRALIGLGGGGALALAIRDSRNEINLDFKKMRIVRGVREAAEIIYQVTSGDFYPPYQGEIFRVNQPFKTTFLNAPRPQIISCSMGPQMLRMGGRIADGVQIGDVVPDRVADVMADLEKGLAKRTWPADDFRIGNFWAWHIKEDKEQSMHEARRKLFARAEVIPPHIGLDHLLEPDEAQIVRDNFRNFINADIDGSGEIKNVPPELVQRIIDQVSSAGDFADIDREIERYKAFEQAGLTDLAIRVFDEPFKALEVISERVVPHFS
jgi:alkanesulfonate monooxygenase SsuD/methylene tetrahydromethanopterin reductase-like flavin-dependent oxidoreductase (luciferase family)